MSKLKYFSIILGLLAAMTCLLNSWTSASFADEKILQIISLQMAEDIDEKHRPVHTAETFPKGTSKVFCWFKWKDANIHDSVTTKWFYVTNGVPIMNYTVLIPRRQGAGGVALTMPPGKTLPAGLYQVTFESENKTPLRSIQFTVSDK